MADYSSSRIKTDGNGDKYLIIQRGDTLSGIAAAYKSTTGGKTYKQLAQMNNISNPDLIYDGKKLYLTKNGSGGGSPSSTTASAKLVIDNFGIQSNGDGKTLFATWTWSKSNTEHYEYRWEYATGDGVAFIDKTGTTEDKQSLYSIPSQATKVKFKVKPIAKKDKNDKAPWTEDWTVKEYYKPDNIIGIADVPNPPEIDDYDLTVFIDNLDLSKLNASGIEFQIALDDDKIIATGKAKMQLDSTYASYTCTITTGGEYKARARGYKAFSGETYYGEWSEWSSATASKPAAPSGITTIKADSQTSVYLKWSKVTNADTYDIEYTTEQKYFDKSNQTTTESGITNNEYIVTGLTTDEEYFFRVRAVKAGEESEWSPIKSIKIGVKPSVPTTWSSTTTLTADEPLTLYWVHNTEGGSSQTKANIIILINDNEEINVEFPTSKDYTSTYLTYTAPKDLEEGEIVTSYCTVNTSNSKFKAGVNLKWKVRTAGITGEWSDWSMERSIDIYSKVSLGLRLVDGNNQELKTLTSFPFYIVGTPSGGSQKPIGYHVSVVSNQSYDTIDNDGNPKNISKGDEVYAKYFDTTDFSKKLFDVVYDLVVPMSADNINVDDGMSYTVHATVTMDSGLTATNKLTFKVSWTEVYYRLNAEVYIDKERLVSHVKPYAEQVALVRYEVTRSGTKYTATNTEVEAVWGQPLSNIRTNAGTKTGYQVYDGILADGTEVLYYEVEKPSLISDVVLSIYRREFDGTFTKLATGINNLRNTFVTDPHPALDYARYRIVGKDENTGAISYYDVPGIPVEENSVVIQWDDTYVNFDSNEDTEPAHVWSGSMLKIPYNIDVAPKTTKDISLVKYIGRKHPVVYYGTHIDETATWNVEIPKDDVDTLYALRRLSIWMGNVYVREPSGTGYWADISVSFNQKHCAVTIPVTFEITRVEGGA